MTRACGLPNARQWMVELGRKWMLHSGQ